jgi:Arc/MetJ-type ribon-helix-helix transcriptional regulator
MLWPNLQGAKRMDDLILRSAYMRRTDDLLLRTLAHDLNVSKSDLIRAAIRLKLDDWRATENQDAVRKDIAVGLRDNAVTRRVVVTVPGSKPEPSAKKSAPVAPVTAAKKKPAKVNVKTVQAKMAADSGALLATA